MSTVGGLTRKFYSSLPLTSLSKACEKTGLDSKVLSQVRARLVRIWLQQNLRYGRSDDVADDSLRKWETASKNCQSEIQGKTPVANSVFCFAIDDFGILSSFSEIAAEALKSRNPNKVDEAFERLWRSSLQMILYSKNELQSEAGRSDLARLEPKYWMSSGKSLAIHLLGALYQLEPNRFWRWASAQTDFPELKSLQKRLAPEVPAFISEAEVIENEVQSLLGQVKGKTLTPDLLNQIVGGETFGLSKEFKARRPEFEYRAYINEEVVRRLLGPISRSKDLASVLKPLLGTREKFWSENFNRFPDLLAHVALTVNYGYSDSFFKAFKSSESDLKKSFSKMSDIDFYSYVNELWTEENEYSLYDRFSFLSEARHRGLLTSSQNRVLDEYQSKASRRNLWKP
jgi:hypothetical protein